jgi:hypothetical protein
MKCAVEFLSRGAYPRSACEVFSRSVVELELEKS